MSARQNARRNEYLRKAGREAEAQQPETLTLPPQVKAIFDHCAKLHDMSVRDMILGPQTPHANAAKRMAVRRLTARGMSCFEISRHMRRHHTSILYLLRSNAPRGRSQPEPLQYDPGPCPDLSGEWAI